MKNLGSILLKTLEPLINMSKLLPYTSDWIPSSHKDRLRQYEVFRALAENRFGTLLRDVTHAKRSRHYGDYNLVAEASRDAVLGDHVGIEVPGSSNSENAGAVARQEIIDKWAMDERFVSKLYRGETDCALVGDCVYELRPNGKRLRLRVHDPESFFPVWMNSEGDFEEAYLAWEEENNGQYLDGDMQSTTAAAVERDGEIVLYRRHYKVLTFEQAAAMQVTVLSTPSSNRDGVCVVTAGWYKLEAQEGQAARGWERFRFLGYEKDDEGNELNNSDTGFDQVPLFYIPNKETTRQPWGLPEGESILEALVDLIQDHSDLRENTLFNAFPPLYDESAPAGALARPGGSRVPAEQAYRPGLIYNGRKLAAVDLSNGNKILLEHESFLVDKIISNSRTTPIAAGRIKSGDIPSGVALLIALLPLIAKTLPKRNTRVEKLGMMLKYVLRWLENWGDPAKYTEDERSSWPEGTWSSYEAYPTFGSIVPVDRKQVSEIVRDLLSVDAISTETAVTMLLGAGFPIDDATEEVERLRSGSTSTGGGGSAVGVGGFDFTFEEDEEDGEAR